MKKVAFALTLGIGAVLGTTSTAEAQIPVTDVASITLNTTNQAANIAKWIESIAQYKLQLQQMEQQYKSLTGSRNMGSLLNDPRFKSYLPAEWQDVYERVQNGGYSGLTGTAKAIRDANELFNACERLAGAEKTLCERSAVKAAQDKAFATDAFDKAEQRWDQIAGLVQQINSTTDPKEIAELQARIGGEQAAIQNEMVKLQMYQMMAAAEDRLIQQQEREAAAKWGARSGGLSLPAKSQ